MSDVWFDTLIADGEDAVQAFGPGVTEITHRGFDFRNIPHETQDEVISGVDGAIVKMKGVVILGGIKVLLAGNGEHPDTDRSATWDIEDCVIIGAGRRCPEAQHGVTVNMKRCWIHDWGYEFDVRAFGAWAHLDASIHAEDCIFTQSSTVPNCLSFMNTIYDTFGHIGQGINMYGLSALFKPRTYARGTTRALTADQGGTVSAVNCYRNRKWIIIDNCKSFMSEKDAKSTITTIQSEIPDLKPRLGYTLEELFEYNV